MASVDKLVDVIVNGPYMRWDGMKAYLVLRVGRVKYCTALPALHLV